MAGQAIARFEYEALRLEWLAIYGEANSCTNRLEEIKGPLQQELEKAKRSAGQYLQAGDKGNVAIVWSRYKETLTDQREELFSPLFSWQTKLLTPIDKLLKKFSIWKEAQGDISDRILKKVAYLLNCQEEELNSDEREFQGEIVSCQEMLATLEEARGALKNHLVEVLEQGEEGNRCWWKETSWAGPLARLTYGATHLGKNYYFQDVTSIKERPPGRCLRIEKLEDLLDLPDLPAKSTTLEEYKRRFAAWLKVDILPFTYEPPSPQMSLDLVRKINLTFDFMDEFPNKKIVFINSVGEGDPTETVYPLEGGSGATVQQQILDMLDAIHGGLDHQKQTILSVFYRPLDQILDKICSAYVFQEGQNLKPRLEGQVYFIGRIQNPLLTDSVDDVPPYLYICGARAQLVFDNPDFPKMKIEVIWPSPKTVLGDQKAEVYISREDEVRADDAEAPPPLQEEEREGHPRMEEHEEEIKATSSLLPLDQELAEKWESLRTSLERVQGDLKEAVSDIQSRMETIRESQFVHAGTVKEEVDSFYTDFSDGISSQLQELKTQKDALETKLEERITLGAEQLERSHRYHFATQLVGKQEGISLERGKSSVEKVRSLIREEEKKLKALSGQMTKANKVFQDHKRDLVSLWKQILDLHQKILGMRINWEEQAKNQSLLGKVWPFSQERVLEEKSLDSSESD